MNTPVELNLFEIMVANFAKEEAAKLVVSKDEKKLNVALAKAKAKAKKAGDELWYCNYCKKFDFVEDDIVYNFNMTDCYCLDCGEENGFITPVDEDEDA